MILLTIIIYFFNISLCFGYVGYDLFQGFDVTETFSTSTILSSSTTSSNVNLTTNNRLEIVEDNALENITSTSKRTTKLKLNCPEYEKPSNIGPYEVPTQRDVVFHIKDTLIRMFQRYHEKALILLKDIKEATRATADIAKKCPVKQRYTYQDCVKQVSKKCEIITKTFVTALEMQREDVDAFNEVTACNITALKLDPLTLIKTIAMEEATLSFALPGFLRFLNACTDYCSISQSTTTRIRKPLRHMTDQDLVVKHFLTKKTYIQLIKGTK